MIVNLWENLQSRFQHAFGHASFENSISDVINQNAVNTVWTLTLELTPIEDNPNNYKLRYGL